MFLMDFKRLSNERERERERVKTHRLAFLAVVKAEKLALKLTITYKLVPNFYPNSVNSAKKFTQIFTLKISRKFIQFFTQKLMCNLTSEFHNFVTNLKKIYTFNYRQRRYK